MSDTVTPERALELLADRAVQTLSHEADAELRALLAQFPELNDDLMDLAASAVHLSQQPTEEALPAALETALYRQAAAFEVGAQKGAQGRGTGGASVVPFTPTQRPASRVQRAGNSGRAAWWLAAAATLLAVIGWWGRLGQIPGTPPVENPPQMANNPETLSVLPASLHKDWTKTEDPAAQGVSGEIIWNTEEQQGFMRFQGLPANDPSEYQYQLWIFDARQDDKYPIDGGVFNIPPNDGEVIVPIDPKIEVTDPTLFAITIEKPGGVVVSSRERLVVVAPVA